MHTISKHRMSAGWRLVLGSGVLACCGVASAQQPPAAEPGTATIPVSELPDGTPPPAAEEKKDAGSPTRLEDVVVTATKRKRRVRDVPASITAFDGKKLEEQGKVGLLDYLEEAPGVTADTQAPGVLRVSMRGISVDTAPASGQPPPTGIFINDVAFSDPYVNGVQPDLSAFDLQSVEVLKGPQGTLFGGTALSGAIRFVLQDPLMGEWQGRAFTQYTDLAHGSNAFTSGAAVNAPIYEDKLAFRGVYVKRGYAGLHDNTYYDPRQKDIDGGSGEQIRGILAWKPFEALNIKLTHLYQDFEGNDVASNADRPDKYEKSRNILPLPVNNHFSLDSVELGYDFGPVKLISLSSLSKKYLFFSADVTAVVAGPPPPNYPQSQAIRGDVLDDSEAFAQELRIQSGGNGNFQWLLGAYYYDYDVIFSYLIDPVSKTEGLGANSQLRQLLAGTPLDLVGVPTTVDDLNRATSIFYALADVTVQERALFFDLSQKLFDKKLELSAGARLYKTSVFGGYNADGVLARQQNNGMAINNEDNSITEKGVSPKVAALYKFTRNQALYALAARGFRFGGINSAPSTATSEVPEIYKSDTLWNYELGYRSNWFNRALQFDITGFYIDYKNPQIPQSTEPIPIGYTDNVAGAVSKGFETSIKWATPIPTLTLSLAGGITDARTTSDFRASNGTIVPSGTQLPGAAKSQISSSITMALPLGGGVFVAPNIDYLYVGKGYGDLLKGYEINNFGVMNTGLVFVAKSWPVKPALSFTVTNVFDLQRTKGGAPGEALTGQRLDSYLLSRPRTFNARFSLDF